MRILVLIHEYPPIGGGGGRVAQDVARRLVERRHEVRVIAPYIKGLPTRSNADGVEVIRIHSLRRLFFAADMPAMLGYIIVGFFIGLWEILKSRPDVIHVHFAVPAGALAWALSKMTGVPYVLTSHLGDVPGGVPEKTDHWFRWIYPFTPRIWRDAAAVTAISDFTRHLALTHYPVDIRLIPNGIESHSHIDKGSLAVNLPPRILFAGRFVQQKNVLNLVKILNAVKDLEWECELIGDGELFDQVKNDVKSYGLEGRVTLTGWLDSTHVAERMQVKDIYLAPSLSEGISMSALQALASGLVIVASHVGGLVDVIEQGRNGYLHDPLDVDAFTASLRTLLVNRNTLLEAKRASLELVRRFDLDVVVDAYEETLLRVVAGG